MSTPDISKTDLQRIKEDQPSEMNSELDLRVLFAPAFALWISGLIFKIKTPHFVRRTENLSKDGLSDKTDQDPDPLHENDFQSKERPLGTSQEQTAPSIEAKSLN